MREVWNIAFESAWYCSVGLSYMQWGLEWARPRHEIQPIISKPQNARFLRLWPWKYSVQTWKVFGKHSLYTTVNILCHKFQGSKQIHSAALLFIVCTPDVSIDRSHDSLLTPFWKWIAASCYGSWKIYNGIHLYSISQSQTRCGKQEFQRPTVPETDLCFKW